MSKNLIKIEGIYNNFKVAQEENFNIFCTLLININEGLINIKNCEINLSEKEQINIEEKEYILFDNKKLNYYDQIIYNNLILIRDLINDENSQIFEGYNINYLDNLINFIFQFIYNEIYIQGNMTFESIKLINS